MKETIQNRKLNRLKEYDYSSEGFYFITICTKKMVEWFGKIEKGEMTLSEEGRIANNQWLEIPRYYENIDIDEFVVLPNHIHGIIIIKDAIFGRTEHCSVPTINKNEHYGTVSKIIKSFKEIVSKNIRKQCRNYDFQWQRSFYDHIIRNEKSLQNIRNYVINNQLKWESDKYNPINF